MTVRGVIMSVDDNEPAMFIKFSNSDSEWMDSSTIASHEPKSLEAGELVRLEVGGPVFRVLHIDDDAAFLKCVETGRYTWSAVRLLTRVEPSGE